MERCGACPEPADTTVPLPLCRLHAREYFETLVTYGATTARALEFRPTYPQFDRPESLTDLDAREQAVTQLLSRASRLLRACRRQRRS